MPSYRLANPAISAISHAGIEHRVNADGVLEVEDRFHSPELHTHITKNLQGQAIDPDAEEDPNASPEEQERQVLFTQLDTIYGRRIDRRRSLPQLREMLEEHQRKQGRGAAAAAAQPVKAGESNEAQG